MTKLRSYYLTTINLYLLQRVQKVINNNIISFKSININFKMISFIIKKNNNAVYCSSFIYA